MRLDEALQSKLVELDLAEREVTPVEIEEVLQGLKRFQQTLRILDQKVTEATIPINDTAPVAIAYCGDWHVGAYGCNYEQLEADIELMASTPGLYSIGMGDYRDNYSPFRLPAGMLEMTVPPAVQEKIVMMLASKMSPLAWIRGCFLDGTLVTMSDGTVKAIEEIRPGDKVLSDKGTIRTVKKKFDNFYDGEIVEFGTAGNMGSVRATRDHKVLAIKRNEILCLHVGNNRSCKPDAKETDACLQHKCGGIDVEKYIGWREVGSLEKGDYLLMPMSQPDNDAIPASLAYLFGLFVAEGNFENKHCGICFTFSSKETALANEVAALLREHFDVEATITERKSRNTISVRAYGNDLASVFLEHCGEHASHKRFSEELLRSVNALQAVVGVLDGDGHCRPSTGDMTITTISTELAYQMQRILVNHGIICSLRQQRRKNRDFDDYQINIRGRFGGLLSSLNGKAHYAKPSRLVQHQFVVGDYIATPITQMSRFQYRGPTHDFEVEEDHSYLVNGVCAHNCHDDFSHQSDDRDFIQSMCDLTGSINLWHGGKLTLKLGEQTYTIHARHKTQGESGLNSTNAQRRLLDLHGFCDVIAIAHKHYPDMQSVTRHGLPVTYLRSGCYKPYDEYGQKLAGYKGQQAVPVTILFPDEHKVVPFRELRDGVKFLKALRGD